MSADRPHLRYLPNLTLDSARHGLCQAAALADTAGIAVSVAVVDAAGEILAFERHDRAAPVTPAVALAKARTAALLRAPSRLFEDFVNGGQPSFLSTPGVTPLQGGVPVVVDGQVVGAVGISGGTGDDDQELASAIAAAIVRYINA